MKLKGIDVSKHQGKIDWNKVKKDGIQFAMLRMGYGSNSTKNDDEYFHRNVKECERVGIPWGAYLYSYALGIEDIQSEVDHAKRLLKGLKPTFPIAFDMEDADHYKQKHGMPKGNELVDMCYKWLDSMEKEGYYVSLYASRSWLNGRLKSKKLDRFDKWLAEWTSNPKYKGKYLMWQYSATGRVNGIYGNVDMNIAYSDFRFGGKINDSEKENTENSDIREYHLVRSGDTLSGIAVKYNTSVGRLMELNPSIKNKNMIHVNDKVRLSGSVNTNSDTKKYKIRGGDTLSEIAVKFDTNTSHLMKLNPSIKNPNRIFVGQTINVPK